MASANRDRARILAFVALALLLLGGAAWFVAKNTTWTQERVWVGYQGEARSNDFLAAQRLLAGLGRDVHGIEGLPLRSRLGPHDALILPRRETRLTAGQVAYLREWVQSGGLLIAEGTFAEDPGSARQNDPLFQSFGARMVRSGVEGPKEKDYADPEAYDKAMEAFRHKNGVVDLEVNGVPCTVDFGPWEALEDRAGAAQSSVSGPSGVKALVYGLGDGDAFLFTRLFCLDNRSIAEERHADFLAALVAKRPAGGRVWIVYREQPPSLLAWLRAYAWTALLALSILLLAGLWRAARSLGPWIPAPALARRSLLEHLAAAGRFQWAVREGEPLLAAAQAALRSRLQALHPAVAALDPDAQVRALAELSGLPETRVFKALRYGRHADARNFTEAIQTISLLRKLP